MCYLQVEQGAVVAELGWKVPDPFKGDGAVQPRIAEDARRGRRAWHLARVTRFWDGSYYRTYLEEPAQPAGYMSVQSEVTRALAGPGDFLDVPPSSADFRMKTSGTRRDTADDPRPAFVVDDGNYLSARWPGDTHTFARAFASKLSTARIAPGPVS